MSERKLFGTDGIRGKANLSPMTCEIATALGRAVTYYFQTHAKNSSSPVIVVGKDTRLSCYMLEMAFASGVCSQGGRVILTGPLPTPGIAFVTRSMRARAGVMISASHNHFGDNGIKIFDATGNKLPDQIELEIEKLVLNPESIPVLTEAELGRAKRLDEVFGRYMVYAKSAISETFDLSGLKVVLDCANGAGYKVGPIMYSELGAKVLPLGVSPDGLNINSGCGSLHPELAQELVKKEKADVGICLDGDADRIAIVDEAGACIDGDKLIGLYAKFLLDEGTLKKGDTVVGTVMSNLGLETFIKQLGLNFHRTNVGDRYITEYMRENTEILGGEPSGHIVFANHGTTGDGLVAGLKFIEAMKYYKKSASELVSEIKLFPNVVKNVSVSNKPKLEEIAPLQSAIKSSLERLDGKGRILVRYSGTEPLARVMVEAEKLEVVHEICDELISILAKELS